jgi:hypothetical protein
MLPDPYTAWTVTVNDKVGAVTAGALAVAVVGAATADASAELNIGEGLSGYIRQPFFFKM